MTDDANPTPAQIAAAKLAELVARRKAAASGRPGAQPSQLGLHGAAVEQVVQAGDAPLNLQLG